jgi:uncharacterized protein YkwD
MEVNARSGNRSMFGSAHLRTRNLSGSLVALAALAVRVAPVVVACSPSGRAPLRPGAATSPPEASPTSVAASDPSPVGDRVRRLEPGSPPSMTVVAARRYMVELINRDRASAGLRPVALDDGPATRAGQAHAEDMARHGYLGHWGTDGSVPEQRFTDAGGADMVLENASCFTDEKTRTLDRSPGIDPKNIELAEDMFFHEQPPHDGHRRNILKPWHKRVGIGVAQPVATPDEIPAPCFAQEFVDVSGAYDALPHKLRVGDVLHVAGEISAPAVFAGVGLARVDGPKPLPVGELNRRRTYPVPAPYQMYWPPGYQTPIPVIVKGGRFGIDVPINDKGKAGMYEVSVWAAVPGADDLVMVSLRTLQANPAH